MAINKFRASFEYCYIDTYDEAYNTIYTNTNLQ